MFVVAWCDLHLRSSPWTLIFLDVLHWPPYQPLLPLGAWLVSGGRLHSICFALPRVWLPHLIVVGAA